MSGYKEIGYHIIFDIKMDGNFTRKTRLLANCHKTKYVPMWYNYLSVILQG